MAFSSFKERPVKPNQSVYSVLLVLTRRRDLSRSANAVSAKNHNFFPPSSHLAPLFRVTPSNLSKSFRVPGTRVFQAANDEDLVILACSVFD